MSQVDDKLVDSALLEISRLLKQGVVPVDNEQLQRLTNDVDVLDLLLFMRLGGLISGDLIKVGQGAGLPHKLTNIRLTYVGLRKLQSNAALVREHGSY
jgi:hypothetical protein